jgi:uncharacterized RDD family membrane protein YckC
MAEPGFAASFELDNTIDVETPEHVQFRFAVAGPTRRALAYVVDLLIRFAILLVLVIALMIAGVSKPTSATGIMFLVMFALEWGYYVACELLLGGASPGKRALGLRVVKEGGYAITGSDSILRNLLRAADFLPVGYAIGLLSMILDGRFRRLGDLAAGTLVVIEERARVSDPVALDVTSAELEALPSRPPVSADELEAIELLLRRRAAVSQAREAELAQMLAPLLAARMGVPVGDGARLLAAIYMRARGVAPRRSQP